MLLAGCTSAPNLLPNNEINEPLFHKTHYLSLGAGQGRTWTRFDERLTWFGEPISGNDGIYVDPRLMHEAKTSEWSSFTLTPAFWNFLLTGEQFSEAGSLITRKLALTLHGGVSGFFYSQADGLYFTGLLALQGKFLLSETVFLHSIMEVETPDLRKMGTTINSFSLGVGKQITERNSLRLDYGILHFNIPRYSSANHLGLLFEDNDSQTHWTLRHSFYAGRKHVFGPEATYLYKNLGVTRNRAIKLGLHYRFVWD